MALAFKKPRRSCEDINCPFHGQLAVRGRVLQGVVISAKMEKTVIVGRDYLQYVPKFMKYERRRSRIPTHSPSCIDAREGDRVTIAECRPLSKTVSFVIVEKLEEQ